MGYKVSYMPITPEMENTVTLMLIKKTIWFRGKEH